MLHLNTKTCYINSYEIVQKGDFYHITRHQVDYEGMPINNREVLTCPTFEEAERLIRTLKKIE